MDENHEIGYPEVDSFDETQKVIFINQDLSQIFSDGLTFFIAFELLAVGMEFIPYISDVMDWFWETDWYVIPYFLFPLVGTAWIVLKDKDGLSGWQWLFDCIMYRLVWKKPYQPLNEKKGVDK